MSAIIPLMHQFWNFVKQSDDKRLAQLEEPEHITRVYDVPYLDDGDAYHLLDVYYPEDTSEPLPVIIDIHGGGWMYASKDLNRLYCLHLAMRGYTVFNLSYRLVPAVTVNEQLQDVMCALQWIEAHLADYPCQKENILLTGDSAGGQLAAYAAALLSNRALRSVFDVADCSMPLTMLALTSPVAYMDLGGVMSVYTREMWGKDYKKKKTYPYMNFDALMKAASFPPTFLVTSSGDFMALQQTRRAAHDLKAKGVRVDLMDFPKFEGENLPHVFSIIHPESKPAVLTIERMLKMYKEAIADKQAAK